MNDKYAMTYNAQLVSAKATGQISSGINLKLSEVFQDAFVLLFKFKTTSDKILQMMVACKNHSEIVGFQSQLKKIRATHKNVTIHYAETGNYHLVSEITSASSKHSLFKTPNGSLNVSIDSDSDDESSDYESDLPSDLTSDSADMDSEDYGGKISNIHTVTTLDGKTLYGFDLQLLPFMSQDALGEKWQCVIDDSKEAKHLKDENKKYKGTFDTFLIKVNTTITKLNIMGKPTVHAINSLNELVLPNNVIKKHCSQHLAHASNGMINFIVIHTTNLIHFKNHRDENGKPCFDLKVDPNEPLKDKNGKVKDTKPINKGIVHNITESILMCIASECSMNSVNKAFINIPNLVSEMKNLTHIKASNKTVKKHLQDLINSGYLKVDAQNQFPKDLVNSMPVSNKFPSID